METKEKKEALDDFLGEEPKKIEKEDEPKVKTKDGLMEKVDRKLVVEDGRELLREITHKR